MEKRKRLLAIGAIVNVKQFKIVDLGGDGALIREHVSKEEMSKTLNPYYYKRNLKRMAKVISQRIVRMFIKKLVDHMMEGERVLLPYDRKMYIGVMPPREDLTVGKRYLNLHTAGKVYGIKLEGLETKTRYHFKLKPARRFELRDRIVNGQEFYG